MPSRDPVAGPSTPGGLTPVRAQVPDAASRRVRALCADDIEQVAALRPRAFRGREHDDPVRLAEYLERIFLGNPYRDDELPSLVHEDAAGRVTGFLGAVPRAMSFHGSGIRAVVATQMMVAPESRGLAALELARALVAGPQDLTLSDAVNEPARRILARVGAQEVMLHGFTWERVIRPVQRLRSSLPRDRVLLRAAGVAAQPLIAMADAAATRHTAFRATRPEGSMVPVDAAEVVAAADKVLAAFDLRPVFDAQTYAWLLKEAGCKKELGPLSGGIVHAPAGDVAGWFLQYVAPRSASFVLQFAARRGKERLVMEHLLQDALRRGAVAATGRLDASLLPLAEEMRLTLRRQPPWTMAHSRRPELLRAIETGRAFLSRLDGEGWLSF